MGTAGGTIGVNQSTAQRRLQALESTGIGLRTRQTSFDRLPPEFPRSLLLESVTSVKIAVDAVEHGE